MILYATQRLLYLLGTLISDGNSQNDSANNYSYSRNMVCIAHAANAHQYMYPSLITLTAFIYLFLLHYAGDAPHATVYCWRQMIS
jgi:hypothetical protein